MLLGFMDPSSHKVWDWPYQARGILPVEVDGVRIEPKLVTDGQEVANRSPLATYRWNGWDLPVYKERLKRSYWAIAQAMSRCDLPQAPRAALAVANAPSQLLRPQMVIGPPPVTRVPAWRLAHPK